MRITRADRDSLDAFAKPWAILIYYIFLRQEYLMLLNPILWMPLGKRKELQGSRIREISSTINWDAISLIDRAQGSSTNCVELYRTFDEAEFLILWIWKSTWTILLKILIFFQLLINFFSFAGLIKGVFSFAWKILTTKNDRSVLFGN